MEYLDTIVNVIIAILIGVCTILTGAWGYVMREIRDLRNKISDVKKNNEGLSEKFYLKDDLKERLERIEDKQDRIINYFIEKK